MQIVNIADEIFRELGNPDDISVGGIVFWLKTNYGNLNSLLCTSFVLSPDGSEIYSSPINSGISQGVDTTNFGQGGNLPFTANAITPMTVDESNILKLIYIIYWTKKQVRRFLGAAGVEVVTQIDADGSTIRMVNKTTIAAQYRQLAKDEQEALDDLVFAYKFKRTLPTQVAGDDTISEIYRPYPTFSFPRARWDW